jgi:hypothetical protein
LQQTRNRGVTNTTEGPTGRHGVSSRACRSFEPVPSAVPRARWFVAGALRAVGLSPSPADLLTSELASNAVDHSITPFEVTVLIGDEVRVEIVDGNATMPVRSAAAPDAERGRGLLVVDALASAWSVEPSARGKTVWFTVPARQRSQLR